MKKIFALSLMALATMFTMAQSYPERVYLTGSATPVGWSTSALPMYSNGDGTYEYVGMLYNGENGNEFKMLGAAGWTPSYGPVSGASTLMTVGRTDSIEIRLNFDMPDQKFTVANDGRYHLTLSLVENKLHVDTATSEMPDKNGLANLRPENLYIVGNGTGAGWDADNAFALTHSSTDIYTLTTTIYGHNTEETHNEFKFLTKQGWDMPQFGPLTDGEVFSGAGTYTIGVFIAGDNKYHNTTTVDKEYDFTIDLSTNTMTVTEHQTTGLMNENADQNKNVKKVLRNGKLYILNHEEVFTATGVRVK